MADFNKSLELVLRNEGKYSNDPQDPGGETWTGIARTKNPSWPGWLIVDKAKILADFPHNLDNIVELRQAVSLFYKQLYWDRIMGDQIQDQLLADELVDNAVNLGVHTSVKFLQNALNVLNRNGSLYLDMAEDGEFGPKTLEYLAIFLRHDRIDLLLKVINILQGAYYISIMKNSPNQERFARGWLGRVGLVKI